MIPPKAIVLIQRSSLGEGCPFPLGMLPYIMEKKECLFIYDVGGQKNKQAYAEERQ